MPSRRPLPLAALSPIVSKLNQEAGPGPAHVHNVVASCLGSFPTLGNETVALNGEAAGAADWQCHVVRQGAIAGQEGEGEGTCPP